MTSDALRAGGWDINKVAEHVSQIMGLEPKAIWAMGKQRHIVNARSLLCYWAVRELGESMSSMANRFGISVPAVSKSVVLGLIIAEQEGFRL